MSRRPTRRLRSLAVGAAPLLAISLLMTGCSTGAGAVDSTAPQPGAQSDVTPPTDLTSAGSASPLPHAARSPGFLAAPVPTRMTRLQGHPVVYLTFDDGPSPLYTDAVLHVLLHHHAKATFFVIGKYAAANPNLVRQEIAAGDAVGDHTWRHAHLRSLSRTDVAAQLVLTRDLIRRLGAPARCFRPPFGETDPLISGVARSLNVHQYLWDTESKDWTHATTNVILRNALVGLKAGAIIVFHDGSGSGSFESIQAVDEFLTIATQRGYVAAPLPC